jgi:hypothetical protein
MATNLVSSILQMLPPEVIGRIASALGLDRTMAQKAISAAIPAVLASLAGLVSRSGGVNQLSEMLAQQKPGGLESLLGALGGSPEAVHSNSEHGLDTLATAMGGGGINALTSALSDYVGLNADKSESLLGLLAPFVMGGLAKQQAKSGLDAGGLASLLKSQGDQITAALPQGFASQLRDSGFLDTIDGGLRRKAESIASAASSTAHQVRDMGETSYAASRSAMASAQQGMTTWPYWLAGLAILAGIGLYYMSGLDNSMEVAQQPAKTAPAQTTGLASANPTAAELTGVVTSSVNGMRNVLQGITDPASAQAALPKLQQMNADLEKISAAATRLPAEGRSALSNQLTNVMPAFNQLCERVLAIPGVAAIAKPLIDSMRTKLDTMARA